MDSTTVYAILSASLGVIGTVFAVSCLIADRRELKAEHDQIMQNLRSIKHENF